VVRTKPLTVMRNWRWLLRTLFAGDTLKRDDIPTLAEYFHLKRANYALRFRAPAPIHLYYGPSLLKPAVLDLVARHFDGVILQTLYGIDDMEASLSRLDKARSRFHPNAPLRKTMLINASVSRDAQAARQHAKRFVSHIASGWPDETLKERASIQRRFKPCARLTPTIAVSTTPHH